MSDRAKSRASSWLAKVKGSMAQGGGKAAQQPRSAHPKIQLIPRKRVKPNSAPKTKAPVRAPSPPKEPLKIRLLGDPSQHHTAPLTVADFPDDLESGRDGQFKWFCLDIKTNDFVPIEGHSGPELTPSVDFVDCRISVQWVPNEPDDPSSNFAEFGPLKCDPSVRSDADHYFAEGDAKWDVSDPSGTELNVLLRRPPEGEDGPPQVLVTTPGADPTTDPPRNTIKLSPRHSVTLPLDKQKVFKICDPELAPITLCAISSRDRDILALVLREKIEELRKAEEEAKAGEWPKVSVRFFVGEEKDDAKSSARASKRVKKLEEENNHLKQRHIDFQKEIVSITNEKVKLENNVVKLREAATSHRATINDLTKDSNELKTLRETHEDTASQLNNTRNEYKVAKEEIERLRSEIEERTRKAGDLEQELVAKCRALKEQEDKTRAEVRRQADSREECDDLKTQSKALQDTNKRLQKEVDDLRDKMLAAEEEHKRKAAEFKSNQSEMVSLKTNLEDLTRLASGSSQVKASLQADLAEQKTLLTAANAGLGEKDVELTSLRKKMRTLETDLKFSEGKIQALEHDVKTMRADRSNDVEDLRKKESAIEKLRRKLDKSSAKNAKLTEELEAMKDHAKSLVPKSQLEQARAELEIARSTASSTTTRLAETEKSQQSMQKEETRMKLEIQQLTTRLQDTEESRDRLVGERNYFKSQAESMRVHVEKMAKVQVTLPANPVTPSHELQKRDDEIMSLKNHVADLIAKKEGAEHAVRNLRQALDEHMASSTQTKHHFRLFKSYTNEDYKTLISKNNQLQKLANDLSDIIADQKSQMLHHKSALKVLGLENMSLKKQRRLSRASAVNGGDPVNGAPLGENSGVS